MMKKLIFFYLAVAVILFPILCSAANDQSSTDAEYRKLIIGTWFYEKNANQSYSYGEQQYKQNGEYIGSGFVTKNGQKEVFKFRGNWKIEDGMMIETITESTYSKLVGTKTADQIILINEDKYIFQQDGQIHTVKRKK